MANHSPAFQLPASPLTTVVKSQHSLLVQQFERDLPQIILKSKTSEQALVSLIERLSGVVEVDSCVLGLLNREHLLIQSLECCPPGAPSCSQAPSPWFRLLAIPAIHAQLTESDLVAIADLQAMPGAQAADIDSPPQPTAQPLAVPETGLPAAPTSELQTFQLELPQARAVLIAKIQFQGRHNGILLLTRSQPLPWSEHDIQLVKRLVDQVAIAIAQVQLEQQIQQQSRYQAVLDQLTSAVRQDCQLEQIFQLAVEGGVSALQVSQGTVLLFKYGDPPLKGRPGDRMAKTRATVASIFPLSDEPLSRDQPTSTSSNPLETSANLSVNSWLKQSFQIANCDICRQLFAHVDQAVAIPVPHQEAMVDASSTVAPIFNLAAMPALLLVPLERQGTLLGCLVFQQRQHRFWQSEELAFVKLLAAQVSTAIIQTQTLRQVHLLVEERTVQLLHSLDVQAKLYEKSRQQIDQLRRLNQVMEEFLSTVSHELLTPLTSMKLAIRMLREANLTPAQHDRYLQILDTQCTQETQLINDLLALQKLEFNSVGIQVQQIDLRDLIRDLQQAWIEPMAAQQLTLELHLPDRPLMVRTEPDSLHRILTELLTNARKYSDSGGKIDLNVLLCTEQATPQVMIQLCNVGVGITPEELPVIFEKFRRGHHATQKAIPGIGLGLALVKGLAAHLSGAIAATSTPRPDGSWETYFTLTLPQSPNLLCG